eukprot:1098806-Rhodomonas_salina.1
MASSSSSSSHHEQPILCHDIVRMIALRVVDVRCCTLRLQHADHHRVQAASCCAQCELGLGCGAGKSDSARSDQPRTLSSLSADESQASLALSAINPPRPSLPSSSPR